jgi:hypothetical protein
MINVMSGSLGSTQGLFMQTRQRKNLLANNQYCFRAFASDRESLKTRRDMNGGEETMWNQGSNAQHNEHFGQGHQGGGNAAYPAGIRDGAYEGSDGASHGYNGMGAHVDYAEREYPERGDSGFIRGPSHSEATRDPHTHQVYTSGHEVRNYGEHPGQSGYEYHYGQSGAPDRGHEGQYYEYMNQPGYDSCNGQAQYEGYTTQYPAEASYGYPEIQPSKSQSTGMTDTVNTAALRKGEERAGLQKMENETVKPETMSKPPINAPAPKPAVFSVKKNPSNGKAVGPRLAFGFKSASKVKATINPLKAALETDEQEREEAERKEEAERDAKRQKLGIAPPLSEAIVRAPSAPPPGQKRHKPCEQQVCSVMGTFIVSLCRLLDKKRARLTLKNVFVMRANPCWLCQWCALKSSALQE